MKRNTRASWIACMLVGLLAAGALAEEASPLEAGVDLEFFSAYVWRGQVLSDRAVFQPGLTVSKWGFSVNAWSSMNLDGTDSDGEFTEMDWTVSYAHAVGLLELEVGFAEYTFPNTTDFVVVDDIETGVALGGTREVFLAAGLDVLLSPTLTIVRDIDAVDGFYGSLSIGHSFELTERIGLELSASLGAGDKDYNDAYFGYDKSALNDLVVGVSLPIAVTEFLSITPSAGYMVLPDSSLADAGKDAYGKKEIVFGGVGLSVSF